MLPLGGVIGVAAGLGVVHEQVAVGPVAGIKREA